MGKQSDKSKFNQPIEPDSSKTVSIIKEPKTPNGGTIPDGKKPKGHDN